MKGYFKDQMPHPNIEGPKTDRVRVRRFAKRAAYDRASLLAILDDGVMCHVGITDSRGPVVMPTLYWRDDDHIYIHGSRVSATMRSAQGHDICISVTHLDGLVLARSAFHHSANYRAITLFGRARAVEGEGERRRQMRAMLDRYFPGRGETLRPLQFRELKATTILALPLDEASAKIRRGPPQDPPADLDWPVWAGVLPFQTVIGPFEPDLSAQRTGDLKPPAFRQGFVR